MSLKVDYKNDMYSGKRRYLLTDNGDGTYSIDDVTSYVQDGDVFSADDINLTNKAINKNIDDIASLVIGLEQERQYTDDAIAGLKSVKYATFPASGWSSEAPYTQTVTVSGITAADAPILALYIPNNTTSENAKNQGKAFGYVDRGVTGDGTLTLYCYNSKPGADFQVAIKGE